jgi:hypothetical protein
VGEEEDKEKVKEGEYGGFILYMYVFNLFHTFPYPFLSLNTNGIIKTNEITLHICCSQLHISLSNIRCPRSILAQYIKIVAIVELSSKRLPIFTLTKYLFSYTLVKTGYYQTLIFAYEQK